MTVSLICWAGCVTVSLIGIKLNGDKLLYVRVTYKDSLNQAVLNRLVGEVKALNPVFLTQHIKGLQFAYSNALTEGMTVIILQMLHIDFIDHVVRRNRPGEGEHSKKRIRPNGSMRG